MRFSRPSMLEYYYCYDTFDRTPRIYRGREREIKKGEKKEVARVLSFALLKFDPFAREREREHTRVTERKRRKINKNAYLSRPNEHEVHLRLFGWPERYTMPIGRHRLDSNGSRKWGDGPDVALSPTP